VAKAADQFRSTDVTTWGIVAIACWGIAVLAANVSGLVPTSALAGLHASRLEGGTIDQIRLQVADLQAEATRMRRENNLLLQRFDLAERARNEVTQRVGALEVSVPRIIERLPEAVPIDDSVTASILDGKALSFDAEGGSVTVAQRPLVAIQPRQAASLGDHRPAPVSPDAIGIALGFPVAAEEAEAQWQALLAKVGTLLLGLWPVLAETENGDGRLVVAGPLASQAQASELCGRMSQVGIPCELVPFVGEALPILN
jgi:hypothetical protein